MFHVHDLSRAIELQYLRVGFRAPGFPEPVVCQYLQYVLLRPDERRGLHIMIQ